MESLKGEGCHVAGIICRPGEERLTRRADEKCSKNEINEASGLARIPRSFFCIHAKPDCSYKRETSKIALDSWRMESTLQAEAPPDHVAREARTLSSHFAKLAQEIAKGDKHQDPDLVGSQYISCRGLPEALRRRCRRRVHGRGEKRRRHRCKGSLRRRLLPNRTR